MLRIKQVFFVHSFIICAFSVVRACCPGVDTHLDERVRMAGCLPNSIREVSIVSLTRMNIAKLFQVKQMKWVRPCRVILGVSGIGQVVEWQQR